MSRIGHSRALAARKTGAGTAALTFPDDEAGLHGGDGEDELRQSPGGAHVPVALASAPAPAPRPRRAPRLHAPQQLRDDLGCVLTAVRGPHNQGYPLGSGAVI